MPKRSDDLERHCLDVHNCRADALQHGDKPKKPAFLNWKEYVDGYPSVFDKPVPKFKQYKRQNECSPVSYPNDNTKKKVSDSDIEKDVEPKLHNHEKQQSTSDVENH